MTDVQASKIAFPKTGMCAVRIVRGGGFEDGIRSYKILVDGTSVGSIGRNSVLDFTVAPGQHELQARIDWACSVPLAFEANSERPIEFEVASNVSNRSPLWGITFGRKQYLKLTAMTV